MKTEGDSAVWFDYQCNVRIQVELYLYSFTAKTNSLQEGSPGKYLILIDGLLNEINLKMEFGEFQLPWLFLFTGP